MVKAVNEDAGYRYERKFFISDLSLKEVESFVKLHPALFSEIYYQRYINNIYFDSFEWNHYYENVDGVANKIKMRIRWYGDLFGSIEKPVLELKIKQGRVGKKVSFPLYPFVLNKTFNLTVLTEMIEASELPDNLVEQAKLSRPVLLNRYCRKYYQSADMNFRITLDWDMQFLKIQSQFNAFINKYVDHVNVVLELKYNNQFDDMAQFIGCYIPFIVTKSSKYVSGIEKIYDLL